MFTVEVAQLFAGVLFPFQVHDGDNYARQHDDQDRQQHDDPRLAVGSRRIRSGWIRRVHDDRHRGAVGSVPASGVRLHPGCETTTHRQVEQNRRGRRVQQLLYGGLCSVVILHLYLLGNTISVDYTQVGIDTGRYTRYQMCNILYNSWSHP